MINPKARFDCLRSKLAEIRSTLWKFEKTRRKTGSSARKSKICIRWQSITARNSNRKRSPSWVNQKLLETFLDKFTYSEADTNKDKVEETTVFDQTKSLVTEVEDKSKLTLAYMSMNNRQKLVSIDTLKQLLEKSTKKFNTTCSFNKKIRNDINSYRKERTLYDHVFKSLESQILQEENKLMVMLQKNNGVLSLIKGVDENLANILDMVARFKNENFFEIIKDEQTRYGQILKTANTISKKSFIANTESGVPMEEEKTVLSPQAKTTKKDFGGGISSTMRMSKSPEALADLKRPDETAPPQIENLNENRVIMIEKAIKEFKYKTEENEIDNLIWFINQNNINLEISYKQLNVLELEVGSTERSIGERIQTTEEAKD